MKFRLKILKVSLFVLLVLTGVYIFHYAETGRSTIGGVEAENTVEDVNVAEKVVAIDSGHGGILETLNKSILLVKRKVLKFV